MARTIREQRIYPITTRTLQVLRVTDVTPGMRRVTLGGDQLAPFTAPGGFPVGAFRADGVDDDVKLFFTYPGDDAAIVPAQGDGVLDWPRDPFPLVRTYTIRRWDAESGEVDIDFVKHGTGAATTWATRCAPGDSLPIAGPKMSALQPEGVDWLLIAGDETALPAIGRWLEELDGTVRAQVFIEVAELSHRQALATAADARITWLSRDGAEPGTTSLLFDAITTTDWWPGEVFAWVAGETLSLTPIRRWLRNERGLPKEHVEVTGYWRRATVHTLDDDPAVPDPNAEDDDAEDRLHELTELVPPIAIRVAATIGIAAALAETPLDSTDLAVRTGTHPGATHRLLRYLADLGVVSRTGTDGITLFGLTELGRVMLDDDTTDELDLTGLRGRRDTAIFGLLQAVRTGRASYPDTFGTTFTDLLHMTPALGVQHHDETAEHAGYVAPALAADAVFAGLGSLWVTGRGAGVHAESLAAAWPQLRIRVLAHPSEIQHMAADLGRLPASVRDRVTFQAGSPFEPRRDAADAFLIVSELGQYPDADAVHILRQAVHSIGSGGPVVVLDEALDEATATDHDLEHDLVELCITGGGFRTDAEFAGLVAAAGLCIAERRTVGWGASLHLLRAGPTAAA